jgi:histone-lysine N-methyltransferase SUV420H
VRNEKIVLKAADHQHSAKNVTESHSINGTVRNLRSRTVRSVSHDTTPSIDSTISSTRTQPNLHEGRPGMRLRNHKTLESTPSSTLPSVSTSPVSSPIISAEPEAPSASCDIYEFNESGSDGCDQILQKSGSSLNVDKREVRPTTPRSSQEVLREPVGMASPGGRLKLTLRMKRSPVLDEVIESGNSMGSDGHVVHQRQIPVYEVLRMEGLEAEPEVEQSKNRVRRTQRRNKSPLISSPPSKLEVLPPTKRLRLIFGNESHTIDLPPTNFNAVD